MSNQFNVVIDASNHNISEALSLLKHRRNEEYYCHFLSDVPDVCLHGSMGEDIVEEIIQRCCDPNGLTLNYHTRQHCDPIVNELYWAMLELSDVVDASLTPIREGLKSHFETIRPDGVDCQVYNEDMSLLEEQNEDLEYLGEPIDHRLALRDIVEKPFNKLQFCYSIEPIYPDEENRCGG